MLTLCITPHLEGENMNTAKYLFELVLARAYRGARRTEFLDQICATALQNVPLCAALLWLLSYGVLKLKTRRNVGLTSGTTLFISPCFALDFSHHNSECLQVLERHRRYQQGRVSSDPRLGGSLHPRDWHLSYIHTGKIKSAGTGSTPL